MQTGGYKVKNRFFLSLFVVLVLILTTQNIFATIDSTAQSGNWNNSNTWLATGGIPAAGDTVVIQSGDTVTIDINTASIDSLYIESTGVLRFGSNTGSWILNVDNTLGNIKNDGVIEANDQAFAQHTIDVSGTFDNTNGTFNGDQTGGSNLEAINVNFNGSGTMQSLGSATFYILRQNGSGSLSTDSNNLVIRKLLLQSGSFTAGSGSLTIEGDSLSIQGTSFDVLTNSSSIIFQSSMAPTINVNGSNINTLDLYNCTITGADATLLASNANVNLRINNNLTLTNQDILFSTSGQTESISYGSNGTVVYNGSSAQTTGVEWTSTVNPANVFVSNANDVTITGTSTAGDSVLSGDLTLIDGELRHAVTGRTLTVNGNVTGGGGSYGRTNASTLLLDGSINQNVNVTNNLTLHNLRINKTFGSAVTVNVQSNVIIAFDANSTLWVEQGTLRFSTTSQLTPGTNNTLRIDANGILETAGTSLTSFTTFNTSSGTIVFSGFAIETLPTNKTIGTVVINNSANVNASTGTLIVSDSLVLTNGDIVTSSSNILRLDASATIGGSSGASSMIVGPLQKEFTTASTDSFIYAIGSGTNYRPAAFEYASFTTGGPSIIEIQHSTSTFTPKTLPSGINEIDTDSHYIVRERGTAPTSSYTYTFSGTFEGGNFNPETRNNILVETSTSYIVGQDSSVDETNNVATGDLFGALPTALGYRVVFGSTSVSTITWDGGGAGNSWFTNANWNPDLAPTSSDNVVITGAHTIDIDAGAAMCSTLTVGDGTNIVTLTIGSTTDSLKIYSAASSALTISNNSKLVVQADDVIRFDPANAYDATKTEYRSQSIVEFQAGSVPVDTYGDLILNGATATTGTGTIVTEGDLHKQGTSTFTSSNTITVNGDSLLISGGTFTPSTVFNFNGIDFQISGTSQFVGGTGTVNLMGSNFQTLTDNSSNLLTFNNLTIDKSSNNVTLNDPVLVNGIFTATSGLLNTTSTNLLVINDTGSAAGGNSSSYVDGPMAHIGTGNKFYPLGDGGEYRALDLLNVLGTFPAISLEMVSSNPNGTAGTGLNNISIIRYWTGSLISGTFTSAQVRLYWGSNDGVNGALTDLRVAEGTVGGTFASAGSTATSGNGTSGTITSASISTVQDYTLGSFSGDNSLPVSLTSFTASAEFSKITLNWQTESEIDNQGFNIYRSTSTNPDNWQTLNQELIPGAGNTSAKTEYAFVDQSVQSGETYYYQLESISYNGVRELFIESTITVLAPIPTEYALLNNYPNPFNPVTNIKFQLPDQSEVTVIVYDVQGHLVKKLLSKSIYSAGEHVAQWDATDQFGSKVSSGIYFYQFVAGNYQKYGKMMLIK